jgi:hypothetical protein
MECEVSGPTIHVLRKKGEKKLTRIAYKGLGRMGTTKFATSIEVEYEFVVACTEGHMIRGCLGFC